MDSELYYNAPVYNDPEPCQNTECVEGFVYLPIWNEDEGRMEHEKERCPHCEDGFLTE